MSKKEQIEMRGGNMHGKYIDLSDLDSRGVTREFNGDLYILCISTDTTTEDERYVYLYNND